MKFNLSTSVIVAVVTVLSALTPDVASANAGKECGDLGIMQAPGVLPEGINATDIRQCANHPLGRSHVNLTPALTARAAEACETGSPYGCDQGFCWKVCAAGGEWCWTASNGGFGPWITCSTYSDCGDDAEQFPCGTGGCQDCGCSCNTE